MRVLFWRKKLTFALCQARKQIQASLHEADDDNKFRVQKACTPTLLTLK